LIEASGRPFDALQKWLRPLLAVAGAGTFLYAGDKPLVDSPLVCCPGLLVNPGLDAHTLTKAISILVPIVTLVAAVRLIVSPIGGPSLVRGLLLSSGIVAAALIVEAAGGLIAVKGGIPASGALLGFLGACLVLSAAFLWPKTRDLRTKETPTRPLRRLVATGILLGVGLLVVALLVPWTNRPFPLRLVGLRLGPYWIWSSILPAAILVPTIVAGVRLLGTDSQGPTELGAALGGGIYGTLLFVQVVGRVLASSIGPFPPVHSLTPGAYLGLGAGSLILASTFVGFFAPHALRRSS
jgi:hypothetical protein